MLEGQVSIMSSKALRPVTTDSPGHIPVAPSLKALLAALLFGLSAPLAKVLLGEVAPVPLAGLLYVGSGIAALVLLAFQKRGTASGEARLQRSDLRWLVGALLVGGVAAPITLMFSLRATPAATAALLLNFEGVATTLIAGVAFREAIGRRVWGAIALITLASILLSWDRSGEWGFAPGALGILLACAFWGLDNNFTRNISAKNPLTIVAWKGLGAGTFSVVLALILGQPFPGPAVAVRALLLGGVSYGLSIMLFILALRDLGAARTSALFSTAPFIGMVLSLVLFRDPLTLLFLAALPLMAAGALLLVGESHQHEHIHAGLTHEHRHRHGDGHHDHTHTPDEMPEHGWHSHVHTHAPQVHSHPHTPDLHHRHAHKDH